MTAQWADINVLPGAVDFCTVALVDQKSGQKRKERARPAVEAVSTSAPATLRLTEPVPFPERHPQLAKLILVGVWLYVAALWLLALDQTFNWGIFGPKVPPS